MPWIERPTEPGAYWARIVSETGHDQPEVVHVYADVQGGLYAVCGEWSYGLDEFEPKWLRIPTPAVLLAMEEFIEAYRAWDRCDDDLYRTSPPERYDREGEYQGYVNRRAEAWSALARAEAEEEKP